MGALRRRVRLGLNRLRNLLIAINMLVFDRKHVPPDTGDLTEMFRAWVDQ